jgi:hypothetical protein
MRNNPEEQPREVGRSGAAGSKAERAANLRVLRRTPGSGIGAGRHQRRSHCSVKPDVFNFTIMKTKIGFLLPTMLAALTASAAPGEPRR